MNDWRVVAQDRVVIDQRSGAWCVWGNVVALGSRWDPGEALPRAPGYFGQDEGMDQGRVAVGAPARMRSVCGCDGQRAAVVAAWYQDYTDSIRPEIALQWNAIRLGRSTSKTRQSWVDF